MPHTQSALADLLAEALDDPDPEREAIQAEERDLSTRRVQPLSLTAGLLRAASPLAGIPGAVACPACGRGMWCSPSWRGPRPTICRSCELETPT